MIWPKERRQKLGKSGTTQRVLRHRVISEVKPSAAFASESASQFLDCGQYFPAQHDTHKPLMTRNLRNEPGSTCLLAASQQLDSSNFFVDGL
jgi:hypothetical protein